MNFSFTCTDLLSAQRHIRVGGRKRRFSPFTRKMLLMTKLTFLLLLVTFLQVSATGYSQDKISVEFSHTKISKVLHYLEKKSGYTFYYNNDEMESLPRIDLKVDNATVPQVLDSLSHDLIFNYSIMDNKLVVIRTGDTQIQIQNIHGKVTDTKGNALVGVTVQVKGTSKGTVTDANGEFSIEAPENATLVVSYIGYQTEEVAVGGKTSITITLKTSATGLNEVVVVGYGTQKKIDLTGAVDQISGKELANRPITNLATGLEGLIPNLNVNLGSGEPGQAATFNIRGITSVNGGGPLVLVDGVEMDPNLISPADIQSVTVLKDAASAAIYGSRAAYGVILITTKTPPKNGKLRVDYTASYTLTRPTKMPKYLNSLTYVRMHMLANHNGQISGGATASNPFTELDSINVVKYFNDPKNNQPVYVDPNNPNLYRYVGNTNWIKEEYPGWAPMTDHNLSLSGGDGKTSYLASLDYFSQDGLAKANHEVYRRFNPTIKLNSDVTSWLNLDFKATLNHTEDNNAENDYIGSSTSLIFGDSRPTMPVRHPDGHFSGQGEWSNPIAIALQNGRNITQVNDLWFTGGFQLKPVSHLIVNGNFNWNLYNETNQQNWKEFPEYGVNGVLLDNFPWTIPDAVQNSSENDKYLSINLFAQYENTFGKNFIKGMVGYNQELKQYKGFNVYVKDLIDQDIPAINLNNDSKPTVGGNQNSWAIVGTFFRLNYSYDDKYLLEINGRYDGSSRFGGDNRYVFSPSVSAGWRISRENFFKPLQGLVNDLKLRASYGVLGNQSFNSANTSDGNLYPYLATLPIGSSGYIFDNNLEPTVGAPGLVSSNFTWEKVATQDAGIDLTMFRNRLSTTFDYYIRNTDNMLVPGAPLPAVLGTSAPSRNAANLRTQGWELNMQWQDRINSDWSYNVGFVLSNYNARITKYDLNPNKIIGATDYYPGYEFGQIWGFVTQGFFQTDQQAKAANQSALYGGQLMAGDIQYKDLNGDGKITYGDNTVSNPGDQKIIGNSTPQYQFGLNLSVTYKNFDFTVLLQGVGKENFMPSSGDNYFWGFTSEWAVPMVWNDNYWTPQHPNAYFPVLRFGGADNFLSQTKYLQNAAYMRLKNISIGYNFSTSLLQKIKIQRLRVYVTGENILTLTNLYPAYDPELLNAPGYPLNKAYSAGIQVSF